MTGELRDYICVWRTYDDHKHLCWCRERKDWSL